MIELHFKNLNALYSAWFDRLIKIPPRPLEYRAEMNLLAANGRPL